MFWKADNRATQAAREVFPDHLPRVFSNGKRQFVVDPTPFGRVELVGMERGFVQKDDHRLRGENGRQEDGDFPGKPDERPEPEQPPDGSILVARTAEDQVNKDGQPETDNKVRDEVSFAQHRANNDPSMGNPQECRCGPSGPLRSSALQSGETCGARRRPSACPARRR